MLKKSLFSGIFFAFFVFFYTVFSSIVSAQDFYSASIDSSKTAGTLEGTFEVTDEGAASYSVPLSLPPGVGGIVPKLAFRYDSRGNEGPLGIGWSISGLSAVSRCPAVISRDGFLDPVDLDGNDRFCLDNQRLMLKNGTYGADQSQYQMEVDNFSLITANQVSGDAPLSFREQRKDTLTYEYGTSSFSRREAPGTASIITWYLDKVTDLNGNYYSISYSKDSSTAEVLPIKIDYTGNSRAGIYPKNSIRFTWATSPEAVEVKYLGNSLIANKSILTAVSIYIEDSLVRQYRLSYSKFDNPGRPHLSAIQECGATTDDCLPATTFTWGSKSASYSYTRTNTLNDLSPSQGFTTNISAPIVTGDWNGDGKTDIGRWNGSFVRLYISTKNGFEFYTDFQMQSPGRYPNNYQAYPFITGDWNGDGRTDFARLITDYMYAYVWTPGTTPSYTQYAVWHIPRFCGKVSMCPIYAADFNGDGLTDIAATSGSPSYRGFSGVKTFLSSGVGFIESGSIANLFPTFLGRGESETLRSPAFPVIVGDWNGDGLADFGYLTKWSFEWYYARPDGNFSSRNWTYFNLEAFGFGGDINRSPVFVGDWNSDGLSDFGFVGSEGLVLFDGTGDDFSDPRIVSVFGIGQGYRTNNDFPIIAGDFNRDGFPDVGRVASRQVDIVTMRGGVPTLYASISDLSPNQGYNTGENYPIVVGDWNGDGFADIARVNSQGVTTYTKDFYESQGITEIKNGFGAKIKINFGLLTDSSLYVRGGTEPLAPVRLVSSIDTLNGLGTYNRTSYTYYGLKPDETGRSSGGFEKIVAKDERLGITTTTWFTQSGQFKGRAYKTEKNLSNGTLILKHTNTLKSTARPNNSYFLYVSSAEDESYELDGTLIDRKIVTTAYDDYGSPTEIKETHLDGNYQITTHTYENNTSSWIIGRLIQTKIARKTPLQPELSRTSSFTYDYTTGVLLREVLEPDNQILSLTKSYNYDVFGNIISTTTSGPLLGSRTETVQFDSQGIFPVKLINALGHTVKREYDARHGIIKKLIDQNELVTESTYDSFGRFIYRRNPDNTETRVSYAKDLSNELANSSYLVRTESSGGLLEITYHDKLGRQIRRETRGFNGERIFLDSIYNERNEASAQSAPYFAGAQPVWTVTESDILGRATCINFPGGGSEKTQYSGLISVSTDPNGKVKTRQVNNLGLLLAITDDAGTTTYTHDSLGRVIRATDVAGNSTEMTYDARGNRTSIKDLDSGKSTFNYSSLGELITETRSDGSIIKYTYDLLGRLVKRDTPDGVESWEYDQSANGIGLLSKVRGLNGYLEVNHYDSLSRLAQVTRTIQNRNYIFIKTFDELGREKEVISPGGWGYKNLYNSFGYLQFVARRTDNYPFWSALEIDAAGRIVTEKTHFNGIITQRTYDPNQGYLTQIKAGSLMSMSFNFDKVGNLVERKDNIGGFTEKFSYDSLYRLVKSQVDNRTPIVTTYDRIGNITSKSDVGTYYYRENGTGPHALTSVQGYKPNSYKYDGLGRRIKSYQETVTYTWFGAPASIKNSTTLTTFLYDPNNQPYLKKIYRKGASGGFDEVVEEKVSLDGMFDEVNIGGLVTKKYYVKHENEVFAIFSSNINGARQVFLHKDHQGSVVAVSDRSGALVERLSFDAWGLKRATDWTNVTSFLDSEVEKSYTGHEYLDESILIHMRGRVYDPSVGRFLTPDIHIQEPSNSQAFNRYSYVLNNPLSFTDPSGYSFLKKFKKLIPLAVSIAVGFYAGPQVAAFFGKTVGLPSAAAIFASGAVTGVAISTATSIVTGGGISDGFRRGIKNAPWNGAGALFANQIGDLFDMKNLDSWGMKNIGPEYLQEAKAIAHGVVQGALGEARGGSFVEGFAAGAGGSWADGVTGIGGTFRSAVTGGVAAAVAGGRFLDGAMQATFVHLYNSELHKEGSCPLGIGCMDTMKAAARAEAKMAEDMMFYDRLSRAVEKEAYSNYIYSKEIMLFREGIIRPAAYTTLKLGYRSPILGPVLLPAVPYLGAAYVLASFNEYAFYNASRFYLNAAKVPTHIANQYEKRLCSLENVQCNW